MKRTMLWMGLLLLSTSPNAALVSRLSGAAYYDTVLDITWLADANYAATSGFNFGGIMSSPNQADSWIASLNSANHLGVNDWRLPRVIDLGDDGCNFDYSATDCGYNVDLSTGEMAHLFYSTLGHTGWYDTDGNETGCSVSSPYCLTNTGPFSNIQPGGYYWSGTVYAPTNGRWIFGFGESGQYLWQPCQGPCETSDTPYAWAVRDGDIALVPVPAAVWLFGSALGVVGVMRRKVA